MGAVSMVASGQAVISMPASMGDRPRASSSKNGRAKYDSICAQKAETEPHMDSLNTGMRIKSTGNSGAVLCHWRRR